MTLLYSWKAGTAALKVGRRRIGLPLTPVRECVLDFTFMFTDRGLKGQIFVICSEIRLTSSI